MVAAVKKKNTRCWAIGRKEKRTTVWQESCFLTRLIFWFLAQSSETVHISNPTHGSIHGELSLPAGHSIAIYIKSLK